MSRESEPRVSESVEHLFRHRAGQMVSTLTRIFGVEQLDLMEDAVQDALVRALRQWPYRGVPKNPMAWIIQVAKNRALDSLRRQGMWREKEAAVRQSLLRVTDLDADDVGGFAAEVRDDQLRMIFACCHPALSRDSQVALTLKTVGGFSVSELARAFLVRKSTMAQRLVRAKQRLREAAVSLEMPPPGRLATHLDSVLEVLYLMFNEGYSALEGEDLVRRDLCHEAIRLCRLLCHHPIADTPKAHALAALLAFQGARLQARVDATGDLLLLREQDRSLWDREMLAVGLDHLERAARGDELTEYHFQAEIAACHALAPSWEETDWSKILACYDALLERDPSPVVALNRVVALAVVEGPELALGELEPLLAHPDLGDYYPAHATHGDLLSRVGRRMEAVRSYRRAIELTASAPVRRLLERRSQRALSGG